MSYTSMEASLKTPWNCVFCYKHCLPPCVEIHCYFQHASLTVLVPCLKCYFGQDPCRAWIIMLISTCNALISLELLLFSTSISYTSILSCFHHVLLTFLVLCLKWVILDMRCLSPLCRAWYIVFMEMHAYGMCGMYLSRNGEITEWY